MGASASEIQLLADINAAAQRRIAQDDLLRSINADAAQRIALDDFLRDPQNYDEYGVLKGFQPPNPVTYDQYGVRTDYTPESAIAPQAAQPANTLAAAQAANPEATQFMRVAGNQFVPVTPQAPLEGSDVLSGLQNMLDARGGAQPGIASAQFATRLGGAALGGGATYLGTDPNDPNRWLKVGAGTLAGGLAAGPATDLALAATRYPGYVTGPAAAAGPISVGDWARGIYRGGIVSGLNTAADVAFTATLGPVLNYGTGIVRDLSTFQPSRIAGRTLGAISGLSNWTDNFLQGLSDSVSRADTLSARAGSGLPRVLANVAEGAGALHGAFQNATSQLIQAMEHGADSGAAASAAGTPNWYAEFQKQFAQPVSAATQAMGDRAALRGDLGTLTGAFGKFVNAAGPVGDALFPVYRMGMAMASRMAESSPAGLVGTGIDVARATTPLGDVFGRGPYAAGLGSTPASSAVGPLRERLTNNLVGTALSVWLASKAVAGQITGDGPSDPGQQAVWRADGNQPHSFVGPDGRFYSWDHLAPQVRGPMMMAGAYADAAQEFSAASAKQGGAGPEAYGQEDPRVVAAWRLVSEVGSQLAGATPMRTFANLYDALQSGGASSAGYTAGRNMASSVLGGLVPESGLVRSVAQMTDPAQRQVVSPSTLAQVPPSVLQSVAENIPGARENLPVSVDMLGRPVANPLQGLGELLPARAAPGAPSPVLQAYQQAGVALAAAPASIPYGPTMEVRLSPAQKQQFEVYRGQILEPAISKLVSSPNWQQLGSTAVGQKAQQDTLTRVDQQAQEAAQRMLLADIVRAPDRGISLANTTGRLATVVPYSPDVLANQAMLNQQYLRQAQHAALMRSLLGGQP